MIPEEYVADLNVRMSLYRRLAGIETRDDIDAFAAELIDRFGPLPDEVKHLFEIVTIREDAKSEGDRRRHQIQFRIVHLAMRVLPTTSDLASRSSR